MGKRTSGKFTRSPFDEYETPDGAIAPILPWLRTDIGVGSFAEPCAGRGEKIVKFLESQGFRCAYKGDIQTGNDAFLWNNLQNAKVIVTNTPWTSELRFALMDHFLSLNRTIWLIGAADWMHNKDMVPYLRQCAKIVSVGRVKWIADTNNTGFENAAWYRLRKTRYPVRTHFIARQP